MPGTHGHMSTSFYVREDCTFRASYDPGFDDGQIALNISGFGGAFALCVTPEQWEALVAAVDSVLPKAAEVTA